MKGGDSDNEGTPFFHQPPEKAKGITPTESHGSCIV